MTSVAYAPMDTKPFDIITEADARVLAPGTTVRLARHGHVTPLADDTLRARRITVVRDDGVPSGVAAALAPPAEIRRLVIGSDHTGVALKKRLMDWCRGRGLAVTDAGVSDGAPADYPDVAAAVARPVARGEAEAGIVIDGAGLGRRSRRTRCAASGRRCAPPPRSPGTRASTTAQTCSHSGRRSSHQTKR